MSARAKTAASSSRRTRTHIGPWQLGRTLGRGSSGRVRLAKHAETGQLAAVKIVPKNMVENSHGLEREVIIMKLIGHPNIMGLYDVWENKGELYLVLEYIEGGELFDYLVRRGRLTEREAVYYFRQICCGVQYCHQFNICHRDLKPENLLLDRHRNIKIADFGMAALETQGRMLETSCGSPHYASPEIVAGRTYHGAPSDIWSCGVILFALVTGHLPFDDENIRVLLRKVQAGRFSIPSFVGPEARDLIARMLKVDPKARIPMNEIFKHPLLRKYSHKSAPLPPPNLDATHPVATAHDIDPEILRNLKTLWHHTEQETIVAKLLSDEPNPEKTFYCLLEKYRESHRRQVSRSASRNSIRSKRSASSRSLRAIPKQSRVSMASINSRFVAERPAPRAPPASHKPNDIEIVAPEAVAMSSPVGSPMTSTPPTGLPVGTQAPQTVPQAPQEGTKAKPAEQAARPNNSFAELIDKAFAQRTAEPKTPSLRAPSEGELLPMIFEEERFADAPETRRVPRKPISTTPVLDGGASDALSPLAQGAPVGPADGPAGPAGPASAGTPSTPAWTASAKTGPALRPVSMFDPARSEVSVARRQDKRQSSASVPVTQSDLERRPTKRLAEYVRTPLKNIPDNAYPPLVTEQKEKVSILRRFTPKRNRTPVTVTSQDYERPPTPPTNPLPLGSRSNETKQNWLMKMLNLGTQGAPQKTLLSPANVSHLRTVIVQVLQEWTKYGLTFDSSGSTITATINSKNAFKLRMSRFTIRITPLSEGSSALCTQIRGAQMSYLRFVGELERVLGNKNLLGPPAEVN